MSAPLQPPSREEIAQLEVFERLGLDRISVVGSRAQAQAAMDALARVPVWGFDTESRPTFRRGEVSDGPHVLQLATLDRAWVFQLADVGCRAVAADALRHAGVIKAGFGLANDRQQIRDKLGVEPAGVLDLNTLFRQRGWRKDMGVKAAVAVLFGRRFIKSGKASTSNWSQPRLTEAQLVYAANDAWAALRVWHALHDPAHVAAWPQAAPSGPGQTG